ncbi:MAG TPA: zinc ribbon domain-containing protein [Promineifilum sp.]|nr:zinc ribbon domain-containing protein [Promineifilum sp.]HRO23853.1 zinc ribbon domain-containing protein [Promineifilum sp.]HRO91895.1 zinc ribbon domain-containing protein [Promineifilum sp.]HRQ12189.1 zinc ribbon domain-containing protein [Promineifilum sp.]
MADRCPNCDKPILATDVVCWHCGYQLPKRAAAPTPKRAFTKTPDLAAREEDVTPADYNWRALLVYGLLTLAIIAGLWLVMRSLSLRPVLVSGAGFDSDGEWVRVTDADLRYTVSIPIEWQWIDMAYRDQSELLSRVVAQQTYVNRALGPLGELADDVETVGLAVGAGLLDEVDPQPFLLIGRSERLRGVAPQDVLDALDENSFQISEKEINTHLAGQPQARFIALDPSNEYQCRHLFVSGEGKPGYLVAACAPQEHFGALQRDLNVILDSFQLLEY